MSTEQKPPKPMPSVAEINAYLERSAARTKMHLPLAKGNAAVVAPPLAPLAPVKVNERALPVQGAKKLPTQPRVASATATGTAEATGGAPEVPEPEGGGWKPLPGDDEH
jgi:hypothetical protein